jgi:hypothetical protein
MDNRIAYNFNKVFDVLIKKHKRTRIANNMGYTSTSQLNNTLDGTSCISTPAIMNLVKNFNVNPTFIYTGEGEMFLSGKTKYKVWIEIERIDNFGTDDESYSDEECPVAIGYRDTLKEAVDLQESILNERGEI